METKDQHNQNPEEIINNQEENSSLQNVSNTLEEIQSEVIKEQPVLEMNPELVPENNEIIGEGELQSPAIPELVEIQKSVDAAVNNSTEMGNESDVESSEPQTSVKIPTIKKAKSKGTVAPVNTEPEDEVSPDEVQPKEIVSSDEIQPVDAVSPEVVQPKDEVSSEEIQPKEIVTAGKMESKDEAVVKEAVVQEIVADEVTAQEVSTPKPIDEVSVPEVMVPSEPAILLDQTEEDEIDEIEESHFAEGDAQYEGLTREQLVEKLEELVTDSDVNVIKSAVSLVKVAFLKLNKEFKHEEYQKLVEQNVEVEGETPAEAPVIQDDSIEERFKAAFNIYKHNKARYNEEQEKVKVQNLEAKNLILEELKVLINSEETLKKTYDEFKILQDRWKTIGMVPKNDINTLWQNYHFLVEKFFDKVKINKELKDLDLKKNLEAKMQLCEKAEELLLETSIIKSFKQLQQYHEEWKEIGPVPQDKKDELWERFKSATEKINERRREYYTEVQDGQEQNLSAKTILCEQAEQVSVQDVDSIKGWQEASAQITELLKIWKTIGPAPKKQNNEIWARFKASLDNFFNAKKDFFNKLKEQQMHNYNLKLDLCLQAESLRNSNDWKNTTRELINLQSEWKKIGPVPRKQSDRIWKRFRSACDEFFAAKTEYFKNVQSHEDENLRLKQELVEKVKAFEVGEDRNKAVDALKDFQRQWMDIGFIPIKEKERIQNEFRAAINKHFEKLKMDSVAIGAQNYRSKIERMSKDAPEANRVIGKERNFLLGKIQQLQEDIKLWENNIGFFAESKTANLLKTEFEKKINKAKEELVQFEAKLKVLRESN
ncbi:MAG: DUF349 domain-containing protein [Lentimicrobiaceae bacterium]